MINQEKKSKSKTKNRFLVFCLALLLILVIILGIQYQSTNPVSPNQPNGATHSPSPVNAISINVFYTSESLEAPVRYSISSDGANTYAGNSTHNVYGGSADSGGVDGADAAAVINAAVDSLKAIGGKIEISEGVYRIRYKVSLLDNVALSCKGALFVLGYNGAMFEFAGVKGAALEGAKIDGNRDRYIGNPIILRDQSGVGSTQNTITNNHISKSGNRGISVEGSLSGYNNLSFNIIHDVAKEGVMVSRSSYNLVYGNVVNKTGYHGIISTGGSFNNISCNLVNDAGANYVSGFAHGIAVDGNEGKDICVGTVIINNTVNGAYMVGVEVADGANEIAVIGNSITKTRAAGIFFGGAVAMSRGAVISGNILSQVGTQGDQGILVSGVSTSDRTWAVAVTDNVVDTAGVDGIRIKWVTDGNVTGNTCRGCGGYGLAFEDSNTDCILIVDNNLRDNALGSMNLHRVSSSASFTNAFHHSTNIAISKNSVANKSKSI